MDGMTQQSSARERVLEALMAIIADRGIDGATIREVAAVAGVSIGTVQYYCRGKEEMLRLAFAHVIETALDRVNRIPRDGVVGEVLRAGLQEFLPVDERRQQETSVYLAFAARSIVSPGLSAEHHAMMSQLRTMCADALRLAQQRGQAPTDVDAELFAAKTIALLDGLGLQLLADPSGIDIDTARAIIDRHIDDHFD